MTRTRTVEIITFCIEVSTARVLFYKRDPNSKLKISDRFISYFRIPATVRGVKEKDVSEKICFNESSKH